MKGRPRAQEHASRSATATVVMAWIALSAALLTAAAPHVENLGLYYDEAFLAQQARGFIEPNRAGVHPPGTVSAWILGRPFPLRNAAYLGSLKSQLALPSLAIFGSSIEVLRLTTLCVGLLGLLFTMLWTRSLFGARAAVLCGLLVAADPSYFFFSQYEWGPFTTLLLCRAVGLFLVTEGFRRDHPLWLVLGGLVFGLGIYSRADFAVILAAAGAALAIAHRPLLLRALRERWRSLCLATSALLLGAAPMLLSLTQLVKTSGGIAHRGDLAYKARVLWSVLDGSHFYRVIEVGGVFERLFEGEAPWSPFGYAAFVCSCLLGWRLFAGFRRKRRDARIAGGREPPPDGDPRAFVLLTGLLLALGMLATPGAVRAHHMLNLLPFPHLLVALAAADGWQRFGSGSPAHAAPRPRGTPRLAALLLLAAILAGSLAVTVRTLSLIEHTGGRGRWSHALTSFAREIDVSPENVAVSFDWGFHEPLLFLTSRARLLEPIWTVPALLARGRRFEHAGDERHVYLVHDRDYDLFHLGPSLLRAARNAGEERALVTAHRDRQGNPAFYSIRFSGPHRLIYTGEFRIRFY